MPQMNIFKCGLCGTIADVTNEKKSYTDAEGKQKWITKAIGYHEVRIMDYGNRTTSKQAVCSKCATAVRKGQNKVSFSALPEQWSE